MTIALVIILVIVIWIFVTGKRRRHNVMENAIHELATSGSPYVVLKNIYFEAALKFALEQGAKLEPGENELNATQISYTRRIGATNYLVHISRMPDGSTWLGLTDMDKEMRKYRERLGRVDE